VATYAGAEVEHLEASDTHLSWSVRDRRRRLEIVAARASSGILRGPGERDMGVRVPETMGAEVQVRLSKRQSGKAVTILQDTGCHAGLEIAGDLEQLLT
jgi:hypothetical protein